MTMKRSILLLLATMFITVGTSFAQGNEIEWVTIEEAQKLSVNNPRPIMIDMYTPWCGPCKMMERNTFTDASVISYVNANYYAVKFNAEGPDAAIWNGKTYSNTGYDPARGSGRNAAHELSRAFEVPGYPTLVILDGQGKKVDALVGYKQPAQLLDGLKKNAK
jgi:thioredoxin-related protein